MHAYTHKMRPHNDKAMMMKILMETSIGMIIKIITTAMKTPTAITRKI